MKFILQKQNYPVKLFAFILGVTSIISQIVLLREFNTVFCGNEISYAIILASWLFWIAAGSYIVSLLSPRIKEPFRWIAVCQVLIYFILPATIFAVRCVKHIMHVQTGEIIGIIPMCVAAYLLLMPLNFMLGGLFTLICRLSDVSGNRKNFALRIRDVYLWESLGSAVGGVAFAFIFIHLFSSMHVVFLIGSINIIALVLLKRERGRFSRPSPKAIFLQAVIYFFMLFTVVIFTGGGISRLDKLSREIQWKGLEIVAITDSIYGNIALTKIGDEYSLYENGLHSFSTNDDLTGEESVHFPLLEHPDPRRVLLIGNGMGGGLDEILKYRQVWVDYVELDPAVIDISQLYLPDEILKPLKDKRVRIIHMDARLLVKSIARKIAFSDDCEKYDVVIVNLSDPYTALINRYYSFEFFREVKRILTENGVLSLSVSSSENYLNEEARAFLRSINSTLRKVFPEVKSVPGEANIFLAANTAGAVTLDPQILARRLKERGIETAYVREYYLPFKLSKDRKEYIGKILMQEGEINTDVRPIAYLFDVILWSTHFNTSFKKIFVYIQGIGIRRIFVIPFFVLLFGWLLSKRVSGFPVILSIITTGFSEIIFQLIVILAFQSLYGYAYYKIGLIMASFMAGLVLGSLSAGRIINWPREDIFRIYKITQLSVVVYPLMLPVVFIFFRDTVVAGKFVGLFATVFATLPVIAGFIGGIQYPLATCLVNADGNSGVLKNNFKKIKEKGETGRLAGMLYAVDVLGASAGAIITGTILIPFLGINNLAFFCSMLNAAVFILLVFKRKEFL